MKKMKNVKNFDDFILENYNLDEKFLGLGKSKEEKINNKFEKHKQKAITFLKKYNKKLEDFSDWKYRVVAAMKFGGVWAKPKNINNEIVYRIIGLVASPGQNKSFVDIKKSRLKELYPNLLSD